MADLEQDPNRSRNDESCLLELQGMRGSTKVEAIKDIIRSEIPDILLIQKTKMLDRVMSRIYHS